MSLLKTCRPLKRCFPWKCSSQRAAEFRLLNASRNQTLFRRRSTPPLCRLLRRDTNARTITVTWRERERKKQTHVTAVSQCLHIYLEEKHSPEIKAHTLNLEKGRGKKKYDFTSTFVSKWENGDKRLQQLKRWSSWIFFFFFAAFITSGKIKAHRQRDRGLFKVLELEQHSVGNTKRFQVQSKSLFI